MAGFVALRRETYLGADELSPIGYKIGLELMVKCHVQRVLEVPIFFRNRLHGQSKLTIGEQWRYLEHLSRLYDYKYPRGSPWVKSLLTTIASAAVGYLVATILRVADARQLDAAAVGLLAMLAVTSLFFARYKKSQRTWLLSRHPWEEFLAACFIGMTGGLLVARGLVGRWAFPPMMLASIAACIAGRFLMQLILGHDIRGVRRRGRTARTVGRDGRAKAGNGAA
jgi:dolichol-phosphate mannosyltransferase